MDAEMWWLLLGFGGQGLFLLRFVIQLLHSECQRRSVVPVSFWYFSIAGALVLLVYSVHQRDPRVHRRPADRGGDLPAQPSVDSCRARPAMKA